MLAFETYYHIYNHANGNENLFREDENYRYFLRLWAKYVEPIAQTYAYCLMPNHIHFMIKTRCEEELLAFVRSKNPTLQGFQTLGEFNHSKVMTLQFSHLFNSYAQAYNKMYHRKGSLFMQSFKRKEITSDSYFTVLINYIHRNPVHHGFCQNCEDWVCSSYNSFLLAKKTKVQRDEVLNWFGGKDEFVKNHAINEQILLDKSLLINW